MTGMKATAAPTMTTIELRKMKAAILLEYERMPSVNQESTKAPSATPAPSRLLESYPPEPTTSTAITAVVTMTAMLIQRINPI